MNEIRSFEVDYKFGNISGEDMINIFKDGRTINKLITKQIEHWYPSITLVDAIGNFLMERSTNSLIVYNCRMFTKHGLNFSSSHMIGSGRKFDRKKYTDYINKYNITYILCDVVDFPTIRVRFIDATELFDKYKSAKIDSKDREEIFGKQ